MFVSRFKVLPLFKAPPAIPVKATRVFAPKKPFTYAFPVVSEPVTVESLVTVFWVNSVAKTFVFVSQAPNVSVVATFETVIVMRYSALKEY